MRSLDLPMRLSVVCWLASSFAGVAQAALTEPAISISAAQLVERNANAKGGVDAWQKIKTMAWTGYALGGSEPKRKLSFMLEQQRPASTRFEIVSDGQKSVRVFRGDDGWKMRIAYGGKPELQAYSPDELKFARGSQVIVGPLMDFAAKGSNFKLAGQDAVDGRKAYVLEVNTPEGDVHRVWVDAETYLESRLDRGFRNAAGKSVFSTVLYRDYRPFEGLQIPVVVETATTSDKSFNRLVIERVALNPPLDANTFAKPDMAAVRHLGAAVVDTRSAVPSTPSQRPRTFTSP